MEGPEMMESLEERKAEGEGDAMEFYFGRGGGGKALQIADERERGGEKGSAQTRTCASEARHGHTAHLSIVRDVFVPAFPKATAKVFCADAAVHAAAFDRGQFKTGRSLSRSIQAGEKYDGAGVEGPEGSCKDGVFHSQGFAAPRRLTSQNHGQSKRKGKVARVFAGSFVLIPKPWSLNPMTSALNLKPLSPGPYALSPRPSRRVRHCSPPSETRNSSPQLCSQP